LIPQRAGESTFADEIHIVIRKQLSNANEKYKRIGVIGALAMLRTLAHRDAGVTADDDRGTALCVRRHGRQRLVAHVRYACEERAREFHRCRVIVAAHNDRQWRGQASDGHRHDDHVALPQRPGTCQSTSSLRSLPLSPLVADTWLPMGRCCCAALAQSSLSLAYEELADLVEEKCLAPAIIQWITEHIAAEFADR